MHEYSLGVDKKRMGPIVLKYGSSLLVGEASELDRAHIARIAAAVASTDRDVVIVSSGAVAAGLAGLGRRDPPTRRDQRRAAAAIGQRRLMSIWGDAFAEMGREVGQVLLTNDCLTDREKYVAASETLRSLLRAGIVPIVNENDAVTAGDAVVGDNDNLAAVTAALVHADLLALFTDVPGVFDADPVVDPTARVIAFAESAEALRSRCFNKKAGVSVGGMETKLEAAEHAGRLGIPTMIASGADTEALRSALTHERAGTWIAASSRPLKARRHWMAQRKGLAGTLVVDSGAVQALQRRASLLPSGVTAVHGRFSRGDVVAVVDDLGVEQARGIVRFDDRDVERIRGLHSIDVERVLGPGRGSVVMRPDRMVLSVGEGR
ncbi:MAG: glutamate 5-kinase [Gemmatimonadota bacterium]